MAMSLNEKVAQIKTDIGNAYDAVGTMGGTVPTAKTSGALKAAIESIPTGGEPEEPKWWESEDATVIKVWVLDNDLTFNDGGKWPTGSIIYWDADGDLSVKDVKTSSSKITHTYPSSGIYTIVLPNTASNIQAAWTGMDLAKIVGLENIGSRITNAYNTFTNCPQLEVKDDVDFTHITSWGSGFQNSGLRKSSSFKFGSSYTSMSNTKIKGKIKIDGNVPTLSNTHVRIVNAENATYSNSFQGCEYLEEIYAPNCKSFGGNFIYGCFRLKKATFGVVSSFPSAVSFYSIGSSLSLDADGFKTIIKVGNTCESLLGLTNFPANCPTVTKFVCDDGYVAYIGGAWAAVTE